MTIDVTEDKIEIREGSNLQMTIRADKEEIVVESITAFPVVLDRSDIEDLQYALVCFLNTGCFDRDN